VSSQQIFLLIDKAKPYKAMVSQLDINVREKKIWGS